MVICLSAVTLSALAKGSKESELLMHIPSKRNSLHPKFRDTEIRYRTVHKFSRHQPKDFHSLWMRRQRDVVNGTFVLLSIRYSLAKIMCLGCDSLHKPGVSFTGSAFMKGCNHSILLSVFESQ